jgi:hypothetical protein
MGMGGGGEDLSSQYAAPAATGAERTVTPEANHSKGCEWTSEEPPPSVPNKVRRMISARPTLMTGPSEGDAEAQ